MNLLCTQRPDDHAQNACSAHPSLGLEGAAADGLEDLFVTLIIAKWADGNLKRYGKKIAELHAMDSKVLPRIVNQVGNRAKTQVIHNLKKQTGLPRKTIVKAIGNPTTANAGRLSYEMRTRGGNIRLKYLAPRETRKGVTAAPWGKRQLYVRHFMRVGWAPNRKEKPEWNGHVKRAVKGGKFAVTARSGMFIPVEMTEGATKAAFLRIAGPLLQERVDAALKKLVP